MSVETPSWAVLLELTYKTVFSEVLSVFHIFL